jgi:hypothetical protein
MAMTLSAEPQRALELLAGSLGTETGSFTEILVGNLEFILEFLNALLGEGVHPLIKTLPCGIY